MTPRRISRAIRIVAITIAFAATAETPSHAVGAAPAAGIPARQGARQDPAAKRAIARLGEPWPDARELAERRVEAENLPLFTRSEPLAFSVAADFQAINRDRRPGSTKRFQGTLTIQPGQPAVAPLAVQLSSRGHARLDVRTCAAVPLRLEFAKKDVKGTVFEGQRELKLVTHCVNDAAHEQYLLSEYLAYRLVGLFTPRAFRARLAHVTYVDSARKSTVSRYGMLIERDEDLARRMEGRRYPLPKRTFRMLDQASLVMMTLAQYMIGNTDYSIYALHNVELVQDPRGSVYPVTYDFDYSGLVNASYAVADRRFGIASVRERLYRGPCRSLAQLEPFLAAFRARKAEALALVDAVPDLEPARRHDARQYLEEFFAVIENPARAKRALVDGCTTGDGM